MQHIRAEFGFEIGFVLSRNASVILPYTRDKAVTTTTNFGSKIAINAFL